MCGITGVFAFTELGKTKAEKLKDANKQLAKRGPDAEGEFHYGNTWLAHRRLSILDVSDAAAQPFTDTSGRYTIVFNGEIFNFGEIKKTLGEFEFRSGSDTEVLLYSYIKYGKSCLDNLNGFFAFAIFDKQENTLFLARDRYGIKPLIYYRDEDTFIFASEMKALLEFDIPRQPDFASILSYFQLHYIPAPDSIFENVKKLMPGHYISVSGRGVEINKYYEIPVAVADGAKVNPLDYNTAEKKLAELLEESVKMRLISDVPLGSFLSGGVDSTIIAGLAARHSSNLRTFSIGFADEPMYDETKYAEIAARKFKTNHTSFSLTNDDLFAELFSVLDYIDEPFADSSAIAVYILSKHTRKHVTVALSGDGADEIFGGYHKHAAEYRIRNGGSLVNLVGMMNPVWKALPKSRHTGFGNLFRQMDKFSETMKLPASDRYWKLATFNDLKYSLDVIGHKWTGSDIQNKFQFRKNNILKKMKEGSDFNHFLQTDMSLVLANDMLTKVDMMSMANSLEVRVPFLDYNLINFAFSLPADYKINRGGGKLILKNAFRDLIPAAITNRKKHGFEVPLLKWFRTDLKSYIENDLLAPDFIAEQGIFNPRMICQVKKKLFSHDPSDIGMTVWTLLVFQYWWKKYMMN